MIAEKAWYESATLWINILSVVAVAVAMSLQLADKLQLTSQEIAIGTVLLAVINAIIRVANTNKPISGSPAAKALHRQQHTFRPLP